ncbi:aminotransferase [Chromatiales bacterium (ex Bugula neritina AB1)]|nr:aminotransferase [Chromatiales bacterium (ex Bugula neritina AB1)]
MRNNTMKFDFSQSFDTDLPAAHTRPWSEFPEYNFVGGHNDADSLPVEKLAEACNRILLREGGTLATYTLQSGPQGYLPLREFLIAKLKNTAAIDCNADDILLTSGSLQAIDLINAALLNRKDGAKPTVIVEQSNYAGVLSRLRIAGVGIVSVGVDNNGMRTDELKTVLQSLKATGSKPAYIYTIPTVHNPTGTIMSVQRRRELIDLAVEYDVPIFEDECYADLVWSGERPPALYAMDTTARVIHVGSFSKTIAPALRVGYIVADWSLIGQLLSLKTDAGSGALEQMLLAEYCSEHFDQHVKTLNKNLQLKLQVLTNAIDREFGTSAEYTVPPGGIFLWLKLPAQVDTTVLAEAAAAGGVAINPGVEWSLHEDANRYIRICFANPLQKTIDDGITRLASICHQQFGVPVTGSNQNR